MSAEPTATEIMAAVMDLHGALSSGFIAVDRRLSRVENDVGDLKRDVGELKRDMGIVKSDVTAIRYQVSELQDWSKRTDKRLDNLERHRPRR